MELPQSSLFVEIVRTDAEVYSVATRQSIGAAGQLMKARCSEPDVENFTPPDYWQRLVDEIRVLLCTEEKRYEKVRDRISQAKPAANAVVSMVAAAIGAHIGIEQAILVPFVALGLAVVSRVSLEAWCAAQRCVDDELLDDPEGRASMKADGGDSNGR